LWSYEGLYPWPGASLDTAPFLSGKRKADEGVMKVSPRINDKLMTAKEAVSRFVRDGDQVALGGFTVNRNPMTLIREIIRQGRKNLYLVVHAQGQSMELLIGAGCVSRVELGYGGLARFASTGECFKRAVCAGTIEVEDYQLPYDPSISGRSYGSAVCGDSFGSGDNIVRKSDSLR
jgi:hypothetical protein